jgi:hypothetical protein
VPLKGASPGLLPAWLGYPGKQKTTLGALVCTFSLTFATFKALLKNTLSENFLDFKIIWFWIFKKKMKICIVQISLRI